MAGRDRAACNGGAVGLAVVTGLVLQPEDARRSFRERFEHVDQGAFRFIVDDDCRSTIGRRSLRDPEDKRDGLARVADAVARHGQAQACRRNGEVSMEEHCLHARDRARGGRVVTSNPAGCVGAENQPRVQ